MKILHVNFSDNEGGAAIAVKRLHDSLLKKGYDSNLLVHSKNTLGKKIYNSESNYILIKNLFYQSLERKLISTIKKNSFSSKSLIIFPTGLVKKINNFNADIVNLHWIGNSMISIREISKIKAKLIWTMHSMWPFNCIDHLSENDEHINSNFLSENSTKLHFLEKYVWWQKIKYLKNLNIKIICSSKWMMDEVQRSYLFRNKKTKLIPLMLGDNMFKLDNSSSKKILNFNEDKYRICCIAENIDNSNKRIAELIYSIDKNEFLNASNTEIILIGNYKNKIISKKNIKIEYIGKLSDEISKQIIISSMDVVCLSSRIETFGQVALEALSMGIPCVIFENLGSSDLINHKENGYLAKKNNFIDFSNGVYWTLTNLSLKKKEILDNFNLQFDKNKIIEDYMCFIKS